MDMDMGGEDPGQMQPPDQIDQYDQPPPDNIQADGAGD